MAIGSGGSTPPAPRASSRGGRAAATRPGSAHDALGAPAGRPRGGAGAARPVDRPVLEVRGLSKRFGSLPVIDGLDLCVREGEVVALVGPSGCGKTTLLRVLAGLEEPSAGEVLVRGRPVSGPGHDRVLVFQDGAVFPWATVRENVAFGMGARGRVDPARVDDAVRLCGLEGFEGYWPKALSAGMARRVALARALVAEPDVLLLDEPFAHLDAQTADVLRRAFASVWERAGTTVVLVTHDVGEAVELSSRLVALSARPTAVRAAHELGPRGTGAEARELARLEALELLRREVGERLDKAPLPL